MKVNLFVSRDIENPHADIHTNELTENISKAINILESEDQSEMLAVKSGSDITLLELKDIYMVRVEDKKVMVYAENNDYLIKKPLYQVEEGLNSDFVRISKTTIVNLKKIKRVAPSLKGMMFIELKNGLKDNISRKYLPDFKKALDL
ncbi:MAG: LytTR family transcriptional regulator [Methanobrevibacter thaueri]|jgi:DNA-binding LytR/AlgR family response regulator|uniref:LytTR family DNA-binding domain-containing protein n=1 Tax=Methanobrevibacter thaueri TaxID=190975 RepID=UPI0026EF82C5|nr:LytTR family DNA-binding domain-containing protein [Methanobrevibacter thaueri]MBE6495015.1 LytTR family transcriptional regulator [Methanobrevibacter thaueri]